MKIKTVQWSAKSSSKSSRTDLSKAKSRAKSAQAHASRTKAPQPGKADAIELPLATPIMHRLMDRIAERYALDFSQPCHNICLVQEGLAPLLIAHVDRQQVSVAQHYRYENKLVPDPAVVFFTGSGKWVPFEITQPISGVTHLAQVAPDGSHLRYLDRERQAELAALCEEWARCLEENGFAEATSETLTATIIGYPLPHPNRS